MIHDCAIAHQPNEVHAWIGRLRDAQGRLFRDGMGRFIGRRLEDVGVSTNLRTNAGADWQAASMGDSSGGRPAAADYIALTTDTGSPNATDTTLTGEIASGGLSRAQGTYSHTGGTTSYKISKTFTATGSHSAVHKAGLFNAASSGTMVFETNLSSDVTLATNDTLTIEWTVNI